MAYIKSPKLISYLREKDWMLSTKIRNKAKMSPLTTSIQHFTRGSSQGNRQEQEINVSYIWKEKVKVSLYTENMIFYIENPKIFPLKLTSEFNKITG